MGQRTSQVVTSKMKCLLAQGDLTHQEIAEQTGVVRETVSRLKSKCKAEIEQLTLELVNESVPLVKSLHINTMKLADQVIKSGDLELIEKSKTLLGLSDKKEYRAQIMTGMLPSHASSTVVNQLFLGSQSNMVLDAGVQQALEGFAGHLVGSDPDDSSNSEVIDVTDEMLDSE